MKYPKPKTRNKTLTDDKKKEGNPIINNTVNSDEYDEKMDASDEPVLDVELTGSTRRLLRVVMLAVHWTEEDKKIEALCKLIIIKAMCLTSIDTFNPIKYDEKMGESNEPILGIKLSASIRRHLKEVMLAADLAVEDEEGLARSKQIDQEWDSLITEILEEEKKKLN